MSTVNFSDFLPSEGERLISSSGKEIVDKLGLEVLQGVVASILKGKNVRDLTEGLTQRRVLILSSAVFLSYIKAMSSIENIENQLSDIIKSNISLQLRPDKKAFLFWFLGLTGKGIQNIVRDKSVAEYIDIFDDNLKDIARDVESKFGDITIDLNYDNKPVTMKWPNLLRCLLAIGCATLRVRGSEKSTNGKLFEHFVLASVLSILGFKAISKNDTSHTDKVFWLNERKNKRESDAVLLVKNGVGVKFDIGFIGKGNTEISLDKVSRFERNMEIGRMNYSVSTIILVDNIGDRSRIQEMANNINGHILQMRENYWVYELALLLKDKCGYEAEILKKSKEQSLGYIDEEMKKVDLRNYITKEE